MSSATASRREASTSESTARTHFDATTLFGLASAGVILLGHAPLVITYFRRLLLFEHYEFVPLLGVGIVVLAVLRCREIPLSELQPGMPVGRLFLACLTLAVASLICSPWVAMLSLIFSLGLFLSHTLGAHWRTMLPVWALLLLMVRPPLHLDLTLITRLQLETSRVASTVLETLGVMHLMEGNVLIVPGRRFLVEEACSGIHSVFALLTAAAFYAVWTRAPLLRSLLLMVSAVFWACFMNLVRIAATILAFDHYQTDLGAGWVHEATGFVTFAVAVLFLAFTDQILKFFLNPIDPHKVKYWEQQDNPFVRWWNGSRSHRHSGQSQNVVSRPTPSLIRRGLSFLTTLVSAGISAGAILWQVNALRAEKLSVEAPVAIANLAPESLPEQLGEWVRADYAVEQRDKHPILSDVSKIWMYRGPGHAAIVSIDYPFRGWHELSMCYRAQGWEIDSYTSIPLSDAESAGRSISEVRMHRPTGERGLLLFVLIDARGQVLHNPTVEPFWVQTLGQAIERVQRPLAGRYPELAPNSGVTTQLQMLITSNGDPIPDRVAEEAHDNFRTLNSNVMGLLRSDLSVAMTEGQP